MDYEFAGINDLRTFVQEVLAKLDTKITDALATPKADIAALKTKTTLDTSISSSSTDDTIPSSKAVYTAITNKNLPDTTSFDTTKTYALKYDTTTSSWIWAAID